MNDLPIVLEGFSAAIGERKLFSIDRLAPERGSSTAIIGRTGVGKSVLLRAVAGVLPADPFDLRGSMRLYGRDAYEGGRKTSRRSWQAILEKGIVFVPAESAQSLTPALTLEQNLRLLAPESQALVERRLREYFRIEFSEFARFYPDEVSGGELQRITLMILLSRLGDIVLLDEPTVSLDRGLRQRFIELLNAEFLGGKGKTIVIASHDLDFVRALSMDAILSLEAGRLRKLDRLPEDGSFERRKPERTTRQGLELRDLAQRYMMRGIFGERGFSAFEGLDIDFRRSKIYGITGPSGCGKTSMTSAILRLVDGTSGRIGLDGEDLVALKPDERGRDPKAFSPFRRRMTIVQQDSRFAFFPDLRIRDSFRQIEAARALAGGRDRRRRERPSESLESCMGKVGLPIRLLDAFPRSLSSGEMKRMDIARALAARPEILLLDEPFAHIDFSTRSLVMKAISDYLDENETILLVVTHEDFDLKYFIEANFDFLSLSAGADERAARGEGEAREAGGFRA
jgi:ABC-type glutathione transport system ATPase component